MRHEAHIDVGYLDRNLSEGEVIEHFDEMRDAPYRKMGLFRPMVTARTYECRICGACFVSETKRDRHGRLKHG
jgi:hypothetical protein